MSAFKSRSRPGALRKRAAEEPPTASSSALPDEQSEVIIAPRRTAINHLVQGTGASLAKRRRAEEAADALLEEDSTSFEVRHSASTVRERRRSSSPPAEISSESIKAAAILKFGEAEKAKEDGLYHGAKEAAHALPKGKGYGPIKGGPGNVRTITLIDYQPDVCKDYKETGFCGFGDSCKFLHDRGDYLAGWQLDNMFLSSSAAAGSFLSKQATRTAGEDGTMPEDPEHEEMPFACLICRKPFDPLPVVTLCGHYFHSACAIKRFAKTGKCFACGKGTNGVFNKGKKLIEHMEERERVAEAAEAEERNLETNPGEDIEIEGLAVRNDFVLSESEPDSDAEPVQQRPVRRRPIITIE